MTTNDRNTLKELIEGFDSAMLTTRSPEGNLVGRPMQIAEHRPDAELVFVTGVDTGKMDDIDQDSRVGVTMQQDGRYVSLSGLATVSDDRARIDSLWKPAWKVWFPDGPDDPSIRLIDIDPKSGVFWDTSGANRLEFLIEAGKAVLRGESLADQDLSGHAKVELE